MLDQAFYCFISIVDVDLCIIVINALQPCLLAKIFNFGKYVRLSVCVSVCLFVCYRRDTSRADWAINTKLGTNMEPVCGMSCILFGVDDVTDDVIRLKSRSIFEIIIIFLIFELERRSKAQNVGHALGFVMMCSTSGDTSDEKVRPSPKISSFWKSC